MLPELGDGVYEPSFILGMLKKTLQDTPATGSLTGCTVGCAERKWEDAAGLMGHRLGEFSHGFSPDVPRPLRSAADVSEDIQRHFKSLSNEYFEL